jgi:hypothetical protein
MTRRIKIQISKIGVEIKTKIKTPPRRGFIPSWLNVGADIS